MQPDSSIAAVRGSEMLVRGRDVHRPFPGFVPYRLRPRPLSLASRALACAFAAFAVAPVLAAPCDSPAHRQFDFWLGTWIVHTPDGKLAGINRIEREYDGCVLHERYPTERGYRGESLNAYDAARGVWHQTWIDTSGTLLLLDGGMKGGSMVLEGQTAEPDGRVTRHRISWTPSADGSVRQHWESTDAKGQWSTAFDGRYTKK